MRWRIVSVAALSAAVAVALISTARGGSSKDGSYHFAAIFDNASGIVGGSRVKIAGTAVGSVERVELTSRLKARLVMEVPGRLGPFHQDASCSLLPEGLISEKYVSCDPGRATAPRLESAAGGVPTVPLTRDTVPLSLQDFLNVFAAPAPDRLRLMFNELGLATAGRGEDLNALVRRSNPALTQARRVLGILDRQRHQLADGISQMDTVMGNLATGREDVQQFIGRAAAVSETSAEHGDALAESIRRFPPMLRQLRPALRDLDVAAARGRPALAGLRAAAPAFTALTQGLPAFLAAGRRAVPALDATARVARQTFHTTKPLIKDLQASAAQALPYVKAMNPFLISIRDGGGLEAFLRTFYGFGEEAAAYDQTSHILGAFLRVFPQCLQKTPAAGCNSRYDAPGRGTIPPDDPECGPVSLAPWAPLTTCRSRPAGAGQSAAVRRRPGHGRATGVVTAPRVQSPLGGHQTAIQSPAPSGVDALPDASKHLLLDFLLGP